MGKNALAELRALRASGKTRLSTYQVEEQARIYEEVDEEGYKKVVRERLDQDDFVIDDNGEGYADDGREDWAVDRRPAYDSESEDERPLTGKAGKRKREEERQKQEKLDRGISKYFNAGALPSQPKAKPKPLATAEDAAFMTDLLGEVDQNAPVRRVKQPVRTVKSEARRKTRILSPPASHTKARPRMVDDGQLPDTPPVALDLDDDDDGFARALDDDPLPTSDQPLPSSPVSKAVARKANGATSLVPDEADDDDGLEISQAVGHTGLTANVNRSGARPAVKVEVKEEDEAVYPSPESSSPTRPPADAVDASAWTDVTTKLNVLKSSPAGETRFGKLTPKEAVEEDGSLRFFWIDYLELNGSLCLIGKVKNKTSGRYVSCFVQIDNILRKLYFLPRRFRQVKGHDTSDEVEMLHVYQEVDGLMSRHRVDMHKIKQCTRKYAFELPHVPKEAEYMKLLYPYTKDPLPLNLTGETFSHVFGTNTSLFEQFVLWRNVKGPCWLTIDGADFDAVHNASWCKLELRVTDPRAVAPLAGADEAEAPPLTLMSIALRTVFNAKENKKEVLLASARIYEDVALQDTTPAERLPCRTFTVVRPPDQAFPIGFETEAQRHAGAVRLEKTEQALLSSFLAKLQAVDPDFLIGHQLEGVDYSILLSRMRERKTPGWHRIGRLRRSDWPRNMGKIGASFFAERQLATGRLLCDLANDLGKSLMTKCQSWSLSEMCEVVLGQPNLRRDIDSDLALATWARTRDGLMNYLRHCEADTHFVAAIALKLQMLPLTKVLTNLAGNSWARTLSGTRAERNEYILLHEFHKNKYICPDKVPGKPRPSKADDDEAEADDGADIKKKDKYKGGLVFEPEKGLYDKFILVMDFNSLYPSIIQEFNICFTTVDRSPAAGAGADGDGDGDDERVPEVPADQAAGVLPRLIATLVSRRRQVKALMKDKRASADERASWDIKQLALKLTANSMYGCLGYTRSRFYARPLAMLTTAKGREILRSTKELAESSQLRVIYGDTDSVMINTNAASVDEALRVGADFKRAVNERYRLLEIDIDNVFRRLLLQAKKKYAAINLVEAEAGWVERLEVKGLDMRRREFCALSKEASSKLLGEILSGDEAETALERIHDYLRDLSAQMRAEAVPTQKYIIYTKLGKNPKEYPNADSMPQVQVALRAMAQGKTVRANDVMAYIITGDGSSSESAAKRAYAPSDVNKAESGLRPDIEWYLLKQIFPPVERLCANLPGTDAVRLAECLGLDTRKYRISSASARDEEELQPLESQIEDAVRFGDAARLQLRCRACGTGFAFGGLVDDVERCSAHGLVCPGAGCGRVLSTLSMAAQLEHQIRQQTARYQAGWLVCDDASCGNRTRQMSVYGHRCLGPRALGFGCLGRMGYEYTEKMMYNQLLYFQSLWDVDKAKKKASGAQQGLVLAMAEHNRERFGTLKGVVDRYLDKCGRQWVAMDSLFGFALKLM